VSDVFEKGWNVIRFRRTLLGETAGMWQKMQRATHYAVRSASLSSGEDSCRWLLRNSGKFTVRSMYLALKMCGWLGSL
jgi:hypothetical protein